MATSSLIDSSMHDPDATAEGGAQAAPSPNLPSSPATKEPGLAPSVPAGTTMPTAGTAGTTVPPAPRRTRRRRWPYVVAALVQYLERDTH